MWQKEELARTENSWAPPWTYRIKIPGCGHAIYLISPPANSDSCTCLKTLAAGNTGKVPNGGK